MSDGARAGGGAGSTGFLVRLMTPGGASRPVGWSLFFAGAALASCWLLPVGGVLLLAASVGALALLAVGCGARHPAVRRGARITLTVVHLGWLLAAGLLVNLLGWAVPSWLWAIVAAAALAAVAGAARPRMAWRLPIAVPIGLVTAAALSGWPREDGRIRCADYLRLREAAVGVVVPATPELADCLPGRSLQVGRYPRHFWEAPDGASFVVTTQRGRDDGPGTHDADWLDGAVCRLAVGARADPECFGEGKAHGIAESQRHERLYVAAHDADHGSLHVLPRRGPFAPLASARLPALIGGIYLDDQRDVVGVFEDDGLFVHRLRASDLEPLGRLPAQVLPDGVHYDQRSGQGIVCGGLGPLRRIDGQAYAGVAFDGEPFACRPLAASSHHPASWLAVTWGCDWDPVGRRAYVAIASLGLLLEIDYDSGRVLRRQFIGFGVRALELDLARRRLYAAFFLSGDVIAIDLDSGATVARWPTGRFVRQLALARDGNGLLASANLGIVRIPLPPG